MATMAAARFAQTTPWKPRVVTFAAPRVGDQSFVQASTASLAAPPRRFENEFDVVPHLPPMAAGARGFSSVVPLGWTKGAVEGYVRSMGYRHGGSLTVFGSQGNRLDLPGNDPSESAREEAFWNKMADKQATDLPGGFRDVTRQQGLRHEQQSYLCRMQELYVEWLGKP